MAWLELNQQTHSSREWEDRAVCICLLGNLCSGYKAFAFKGAAAMVSLVRNPDTPDACSHL
jgi:hypothetical protein